MQFSIIGNGSEILSFLHSETDKSLSNITFTETNIKSIIQNLNSNKGHGHDMINIRMFKLCDKCSSCP